MTNLYNFMDGADGLAGGMAVIGFGAYALAALPQAPAVAVDQPGNRGGGGGIPGLQLSAGPGVHGRRRLDTPGIPGRRLWPGRLAGGYLAGLVPAPGVFPLHRRRDCHPWATLAPPRPSLASSPGALLSALGAFRLEPPRPGAGRLGVDGRGGRLRAVAQRVVRRCSGSRTAGLGNRLRRSLFGYRQTLAQSDKPSVNAVKQYQFGPMKDPADDIVAPNMRVVSIPKPISAPVHGYA